MRGQVVIREKFDADWSHYKHIFVPGVSTEHDPDAVAVARKFHIGTVLQVGPPALTKQGAEVPHDFKVGDVVVFHWMHHEKAFTLPWVDGKLAAWVPQQAIDAVVES